MALSTRTSCRPSAPAWSNRSITIQLTERAVKYAAVYRADVYGVFPVQTLAGLGAPDSVPVGRAALVLFYLILLAFSEHLGFALAYLAASIACNGLIGFYLSAVLRGKLRGALFAASLLLLYGVLYLLLQSEDNALCWGGAAVRHSGGHYAVDAQVGLVSGGRSGASGKGDAGRRRRATLPSVEISGKSGALGAR